METLGKNENAAAETQEAEAFYQLEAMVILPYGHCCQDTKTLTLVNTTQEKTLLRCLLLVVVVDHHSSIYDVFFSFGAILHHLTSSRIRTRNTCT